MEEIEGKCKRCGNTKSQSWRFVKVDKNMQIWCVECSADKANVLNPEGIVFVKAAGGTNEDPIKEVG